MVGSELDSLLAIERETDRLLLKADAYGVYPTPVGRIVEAQRLQEASPRDSFLAPAMLAQAPAHLRAALRRVGAKAQALLNRRERVIHLNPDTELPGQRAFKRLHEVVHDLLPWQHVGEAHDATGSQMTVGRCRRA
jgi:hypothetical protein